MPVWKKYVSGEDEILELRRLCCIDDTPNNTESFFISKCLKWLKNNTNIKKIISYSDLDQNHEGVIYKASNFKYMGKTTPQKKIECDGVLYHPRSVRTTDSHGKLKPFAVKALNIMKEGKAKYVTTKGKNAYLYTLKECW